LLYSLLVPTARGALPTLPRTPLWMCSARLSDSPKDSYFAGAPSLREESENFSMDSAASPGGTAGTGDGSPVRRTRSRALHAAVISLELKGEDRCLVRMDVSLERAGEFLGELRSNVFQHASRELFFPRRRQDQRKKKKNRPRPSSTQKQKTLPSPRLLLSPLPPPPTYPPFSPNHYAPIPR